MITREELAARYGTPLYVYDLDRVAAAHRGLREVLPAAFSIYYSFKANPHPDIARTLRETGDRPCRAELCSVGELAAALEAGYQGSECLYSGPGKTAGELDTAIAAGVRRFSVESLVDLRRVGSVARRHGVVAECLVRVNATASKTATSIRMTGTPSQFGIDREQLPGLLPELLDVEGARVVGAHFFPLSNAKDADGLIAEFRHSILTAAELRAEGLPLELLDLGGGFAAPYAVPGSRPAYPKLRGELEHALDTHLPDWRDGGLEIACESGRHLVGTAGELVTGVSDVKESRGHRFVVLDAGINTLGGMAGLGRLLPLALELDCGAGGTATLAGPLCTPGDLLGRGVEVPDLAPGDLVTVPNVGAYGVTASLVLFLGRPAPVEVTVRGGEVLSATRLHTARTPVR